MVNDDYDDIHESKAAKRSRAKTAAERTAEWRAASRETGRPETKAADRAMVEALAYLVSLKRTSPVTIDIRELVRVSTITLVREGYKREFSKALVVDRLRPRARHDDRTALPSRVPHHTEALIHPPVGAKEWEQRDIDYIRRLAGAARR